MLTRDRSKMFRESISKLDRYREALNSKKRQMSDLSSERGSGVNLTKMGSQIHKIPNENMTQREVKTSNSMLNKRIRMSAGDTRVSFTLMLLRFYSLSALSKMLYIKLFYYRVLSSTLLNPF
jgi:hypothetical protein